MDGRTTEGRVPERGEIGRQIGSEDLADLLGHRSREVLEALLESPQFGERHVLLLLSRKDLPREIVAKIARNRQWMSSYQIKLAVVKHPHTPRELSLRALKFIYLFDLLGVALTPATPAELKRLAEDAILSQKEGLPLGQRISLARRGSSRLAARLLADSERAVIEAALSNPFLTEQGVATALLLETASAHLAGMIVNHSRWSVSRSVKLALARSGLLSLARLMEIIPELSPDELAYLVEDQRIDKAIRVYVARVIRARKHRKSQPT